MSLAQEIRLTIHRMGSQGQESIRKLKAVSVDSLVLLCSTFLRTTQMHLSSKPSIWLRI